MPKIISLPVLSLLLFTACVVAFDNTEGTIWINRAFVLLLPFSILRWVKQKNQFHRDFKIILLFVCWAAVTLLWTPSFNESLVREQTCILLAIQLLCYCSFSGDDDIINFALLFYIIGAFYFSISMFAQFGGLSLIQVLAANERFGEDLLNTNAIGKNMAIASIISLYFLLKTRKVICFLPISFFIFFVLITRSRSSLIALIFGILFLLYFYYRGQNNLKRFFYVMVGIVAFVLFLSTFSFWGETFFRFILLFDFLSDKGQDTSTETRTFFVEEGIRIFKTSPIIGHGIGSSSYLLTGKGDYFHNNYIQLIVETGIIGFLLFYTFLFKVIRSLYKYKTDAIGCLLFSIMLVFLICDTNNTTYYHKLYFIFIGLSLMYLSNHKKDYKLQ